MSEKEEKTAPDVRHPEDRTLGMAFLRDTIEKYKAKLMEPGKTLGPMAVTCLLDGIVDRLCVLESMLKGDGEWRKQTRWPLVQEWLAKADEAAHEPLQVIGGEDLSNRGVNRRLAREALRQALPWLADTCCEITKEARSALKLAEKALEEPERNIDRYDTPEGAQAAFLRLCNGRGDGCGPHCWYYEQHLDCRFAWAYDTKPHDWSDVTKGGQA